MRLSSILSEAWRNLASGTTRALAFTAALALVAAGAGLFDVATVTSLQRRAAQWEASGAAIHTLADEQGIDPTSCTALTQAHSTHGQPITAAGALAAGPTLTFAATPASSLPTFTVTPTLAEVLHLDPADDEGIWISDQLAATLAAATGDRLETDRGPTTVAGVFAWPDDGRDQRIAYAVLVPGTTDTRYDECWATITPTTPASVDLLRTTALVHPATTAAAPIGQLNNSLGTSLDAWAQYQQRPSRYAGPVVPFAALVLGYLAGRTRRLEHASAQHAGIPRRAQCLTSAVETLAWTLPALALAAATTTLIAAAEGDPASTAALVVGELPSLTGALLAAQLGVSAALVLTKESHLFAYFKER